MKQRLLEVTEKLLREVQPTIAILIRNYVSVFLSKATDNEIREVLERCQKLIDYVLDGEC